MSKLSKLKFIFLGSIFAVLLVHISVAGAQSYGPLQEARDQLSHAAAGAQYAEATDPRLIAANIVRLALGLVATIIFCLMVYAGYQWMTAGGNDEQISTAKQTIFNSTIGLIIVLSAYGITILVTNLALGRSITSSSPGSPVQPNLP